jgi:hypothetical protein
LAKLEVLGLGSIPSAQTITGKRVTRRITGSFSTKGWEIGIPNAKHKNRYLHLKTSRIIMYRLKTTFRHKQYHGLNGRHQREKEPAPAPAPADKEHFVELGGDEQKQGPYFLRGEKLKISLHKSGKETIVTAVVVGKVMNTKGMLIFNSTACWV